MYEGSPSPRQPERLVENGTPPYLESRESSISEDTPTYVTTHERHYEDYGADDNTPCFHHHYGGLADNTAETVGIHSVTHAENDRNSPHHIEEENTEVEYPSQELASPGYLGNVEDGYGGQEALDTAHRDSYSYYPAGKPIEQRQDTLFQDGHARATHPSHGHYVPPKRIVKYEYGYESISAPVTRNTSMVEAASRAQQFGYTTSPRHPQVERSLEQIYKSESLKSESTVKGEEAADSITYVPGAPASLHEGDSGYGYEGTSYNTQNVMEYDSVSQIGVSFAASERRDMDSEISLPIANIGRLMKSVLPGSAKIAKHAKDVVRECVTEFIMFISSEVSGSLEYFNVFIKYIKW